MSAPFVLSFSPLAQVHQAAVKAALHCERIVARNVIDLPFRSDLAEVVLIRHAGIPAGVPLLGTFCLLPLRFVQRLLKEPVLLVGPVATHPVVPSHGAVLSIPIGHCLDALQDSDLLAFRG
ncbi:hypothetical protein MRBBS_0158 [Marinobacter sp. BSs20148]|nr:hypothetical protein MRBBS_0158 [Marinobacter sp. BSs20148]